MEQFYYREDSFQQPTLDQNLALPQRNQAGVLRFFFVTHVTVNFSLEVKPENKNISIPILT